VTRYFTLLVVFALATHCSGGTATSFQEVGRFHAPNMHSLYPGVTHFTVAPESVMRDRSAVLSYSRRRCADDEQVCFVLYWTDAASAATGFPISDRQSEAMAASYRRGHSTGNDGLQCYNFGAPRERCAIRSTVRQLESTGRPSAR
jgi:hypothetical protein